MEFIQVLSAFDVRVIDFEMATTPSMFMATQFEEFNCDATVMFTASHLPFYYNGLKFFTREGGLESSDIRDIIALVDEKEELPLLDVEMLMDKELKFLDFPENVIINLKKISSEEEEVKMKNPVKLKIVEGGGAFHEKKAKNKKVNLGGPHKRKPPKKYGANRAQQKAKSISKRKK